MHGLQADAIYGVRVHETLFETGFCPMSNSQLSDATIFLQADANGHAQMTEPLTSVSLFRDEKFLGKSISVQEIGNSTFLTDGAVIACCEIIRADEVSVSEAEEVQNMEIDFDLNISLDGDDISESEIKLAGEMMAQFRAMNSDSDTENENYHSSDMSSTDSDEDESETDSDSDSSAESLDE